MYQSFTYGFLIHIPFAPVRSSDLAFYFGVQKNGGQIMTVLMITGAVLAALLFAYLVYALINPEKF